MAAFRMSGTESQYILSVNTTHHPDPGYNTTLDASKISWMFLGFFVCMLMANLALGVRFKTHSFGAVIIGGCLFEILGYSSRMVLYENPHSMFANTMQICSTPVGPVAFMHAIYLALEQFMMAYGSQGSWIHPMAYILFTSLNGISLLFEVIGGALALSAPLCSKQIIIGDYLAMIGATLQFISLSVFAMMVVSYFLVRHFGFRRPAYTRGSLRKLSLLNSQFPTTPWIQFLIMGVVTAFQALFGRFFYRLGVTYAGWGSRLMVDQTVFFLWDGAMCTVAVSLLTMFHPGYAFLRLAEKHLKHGWMTLLATDAENGGDRELIGVVFIYVDVTTAEVSLTEQICASF